MRQSLKKLEKYKINFDRNCVANKTAQVYKFDTIKNYEKIMVIVMEVKDTDCLGIYSDFEISTDDVKRIVNAFFNATDFIIVVENFNLDEINPDFLYSVCITSPKTRVCTFLRGMDCEVY